MRFISGVIIGEINGIALGIAATVVCLAVCAMNDKDEKHKRYDYTKYSFNASRSPSYRDYGDSGKED